MLPFVYKCCQEQDEGLREIGLCLVVSACEEVGEEAAHPLLEPIYPLLMKCLEEGNSIGVRTSSLRVKAPTVSNFLQNPKSRTRSHLFRTMCTRKSCSWV